MIATCRYHDSCSDQGLTLIMHDSICFCQSSCFILVLPNGPALLTSFNYWLHLLEASIPIERPHPLYYLLYRLCSHHSHHARMENLFCFVLCGVSFPWFCVMKATSNLDNTRPLVSVVPFAIQLKLNTEYTTDHCTVHTTLSAPWNSSKYMASVVVHLVQAQWPYRVWIWSTHLCGMSSFCYDNGMKSQRIVYCTCIFTK